MIPTLPEVFAILTLKLLDRLLLTQRLQLYHLFHLEKRGSMDSRPNSGSL